MPKQYRSAGQAWLDATPPQKRGLIEKRLREAADDPEWRALAARVQEGIDGTLQFADARSIDQAIWLLAGELGMDPGPFTLAELVTMAEGRRRAERRKATTPQKPEQRIMVSAGAVYLDGQHVPLDLTPEARQDAHLFLESLTYEWQSRTDMAVARNKPGIKKMRTDRIKASLPTVLQDAIESGGRKGYRIRRVT